MDELLNKLACAYGPSSNEKAVKNIIEEEIKPYVDEVVKDKLGNLIGIKKGNGKKVMISAAMDEICFIISYVDKEGRIKFAPMGDVKPAGLINNTVKFENGICGVICLEDGKEEIETKNLYIDIGETNDEDVFKKLKIGDAAVLMGNYFENDKSIFSKSLGTRYACRCLIDVIKSLSDKNDNELYFAFTTHGVIGSRGARTSANFIKPEVGISIDSVDNSLVEGGRGPVLLFRGLNEVSSSELLEKVSETAEKSGISLNKQVIMSAVCDCAGIVSAGADAKVVSIAVPVKNYHTSSEIVLKKDVSDIDKILAMLLKNI